MSGAGSVLAVARKEMGDIVRERTILAAIGIQFVVAAFSAFLMVGLSGMYDPDAFTPGNPVPVAYTGSGGLDEHLASDAAFRVVRTDADDAAAGFQSGRYAAWIHEDSQTDDGPRLVRLTLADGEITTPLVVTRLKAALLEYESSLRSERDERIATEVVEMEGDVAGAGFYAFTYTVLLPILVAIPTMLAGAIAADSFVQERSTGTLRLLLVAPLSPFGIITGKLLPPVLLAPLQVGLWMLLLGLNGLPVAHPFVVLGLSLLFALLFAGAGLTVASLIGKVGEAQAAYALVLLVIGTGALFLPRDPFNMVALAATGTVDAALWVSLAVVAGLTLVLLGLSGILARRALRDGGDPA